MRHSTDGMISGDIWAYRTGARAELTPAYLRSIGDRKVEVEHLHEAARGRIEWVPAGRLRCPWSQRDAFLDRERRWDALAGEGPESPAVIRAVSFVFRESLPEGTADVPWSGRSSFCEIRDLRSLCELSDITAEWVVSHKTAFFEDEALYAPWAVTERIAKTMARKAGDRLLRRLESDERDEALLRSEQRIALHEWLHPEGDDPWTMKVAHWRQVSRDERAVIRLWIGAGEPDVADVNARMNAYLREFVALSERAGRELPSVRTKRALRLRDEFDELAQTVALDLW